MHFHLSSPKRIDHSSRNHSHRPHMSHGFNICHKVSLSFTNSQKFFLSCIFANFVQIFSKISQFSKKREVPGKLKLYTALYLIFFPLKFHVQQSFSTNFVPLIIVSWIENILIICSIKLVVFWCILFKLNF